MYNRREIKYHRDARKYSYMLCNLKKTPRISFFPSFSNRFEYNHFAMPEHMGTHIDAPAHAGEGAWKTNQIPIEKLYGSGVIINVKTKAATDPDYRFFHNHN